MTAVAPPPLPSSTPVAGPPVSSTPTPRALRWPSRVEWLDLIGLGVLIGLGLYGFQTAYGGSRYLMAGLVGTVLGLAVALWGARTRQPLIVMTAATVGVFFLFGGAVAVPDQAIAGILPSPGSVLALIDGAVSGWAKLLTTDPPVGGRDNLLVVPYLCGLIAAVVSLTVARRTRRGQFAVLPPLAVLALSILFGTAVPASLLLQGAVFAVVAIGWVSLHRRMGRRIDVGAGRANRTLATVAVLGLAGVVAMLVGSSVPGAGTRPRVVLRDQTQPPFDPRDHPSPLSSFRKYSGGAGTAGDAMLRDTVLFEVTGLASGERIRLATMDGYDGEVFTVGSGAGSSGWFQRVGDEIPHPDGDTRTVSVRIEGYTDIWVPGAGYLESIDFSGHREKQLRSGFRYNDATGAAAASVRLARGDRYTMEVVLPPSSGGNGNAADVHHQPDVVALPDAKAKASEWVDKWAAGKRDATALAKVRDGIVGSGINVEGASVGANGSLPGEPARPGHHLGRLDDMVGDGGRMVGDGEQYGPLVALMARDVGVPARVVMGFVVPDGHDDPDTAVRIKGRDVASWVEVAIAGEGWVPITDIKPSNTNPPVQKEPEKTSQATPPPPPPPTIPPTDEDEVDSNKVDPCRSRGDGAAEGETAQGGSSDSDSSKGRVDCPEPEGEGFQVPGWVLVAGAATLIPLAVLGAVTAVIAGIKARRRGRRRRTGPPSTRVAGGWNEVIDLAADMGSPIPVLATRSEGARLMGADAAVALAEHADVGVFGPTDLDEEWVAGYWDDVDRTRTAMTSDMSRMERWRVLVSLASLRSSFDRWRLDRRNRSARGTARSATDATTSGGQASEPSLTSVGESMTSSAAGSAEGTTGVPSSNHGPALTERDAPTGPEAPTDAPWWREEDS